jgi:diguanylate cyclase (GGDEF)-like protein
VLAVIRAVRQRAPRLTARCTDAALGGLILLMVTDLIVALTLRLQGLTEWRPELVALGVASWSAVPLALLLPWRRWHPRAALVLPLLAMGGLTALSVLGDGLGAAYVGVYVLSFVYTGLLLPPRSSLWLLAPAVITYGPLVGGWGSQVVVRLGIAIVVWLLVAELLAHLVARQRTTVEVLEAATRRDALTGLDNRRGMEARLQFLEGGEVLVMADLDHFKLVNDTHGHAAGDAVLADFAALLTSSLRAGDHAARFGGEEFLLVLTGTDVTKAGDVLARLHAAWAHVRPITFSAGYAEHRAGADPAVALAAADQALYVAKRAGRDRDHLAAPPDGPEAATAQVAARTA